MNLHLTRTTRLALAAGLTVTLAACGSGDDPTISAEGGAAPAASSAGTSSSVSAEFNDADVTFIQGMAPHHASALAMAELAPSRAENAQVKDLAERIAAAQGPEIELMQEMARTWDVELDMEKSASMPGMDMGGMEDMAAELEPLEGAAFDKAFLEAMIPHHESALPMAQAELDAGVNPEAKKMAQDIVTSQTAEIAEMKQLLTSL